MVTTSINYSTKLNNEVYINLNYGYSALTKNVKFVEELLADNSLKINKNKIKYVSDNKKQVIMGLLVNKEEPCLIKETKRKIRSVLHKYMTGKTKDIKEIYKLAINN